MANDPVGAQKSATDLKEQEDVNAVMGAVMLAQSLGFGSSRIWRIRARRFAQKPFAPAKSIFPALSQVRCRMKNLRSGEKVPNACETLIPMVVATWKLKISAHPNTHFK